MWRGSFWANKFIKRNMELKLNVATTDATVYHFIVIAFPVFSSCLLSLSLYFRLPNNHGTTASVFIKRKYFLAPFYGKNTFVLCTISFLWSRFMVFGRRREDYVRSTFDVDMWYNRLYGYFSSNRNPAIKTICLALFFLRSIIDFSQLSVRILSWNAVASKRVVTVIITRRFPRRSEDLTKLIAAKHLFPHLQQLLFY